jgi:hypothetical protein
MQLCFVSVHCPRETYFVDEPRIKKLSCVSTVNKRQQQSERCWHLPRQNPSILNMTGLHDFNNNNIATKRY